MKVRGLPIVCCLLLVSVACTKNSPAGPTVPLDQQFTLAPGETASVDGTALRVGFVGVAGDSRCPAGVFCIQGGDAVVRIRAEGAGTASEYELHTGDASRAAISHAGFRIELVALQPYPFSSRTIEPGDYRATLMVARAAP